MKKIPAKKIAQIIRQQQENQNQKTYSPGVVEIPTSNVCEAKVVNFFGDVHTEVFTVKVNNEDKYMGAGCSNGQVKVYDVRQGNIIKMGNSSRLSGYPCTGFRWKTKHPEEYFVCNCDGTIKWYDLNQKNNKGYHQDQKGYLCCDCQTLQQWSVFGTESKQVEIFDNNTMQSIQKYPSGGPDVLESNHTNRVFSVKCLEQDSNMFLSGGWDSCIHIWDVRIPKNSVRKIYGPSISSDSIDFQKNLILTGNYQNYDHVQLWDYGSGNLIQTLQINQPTKGKSYCLAASFAHRSEISKNLIGIALTGCNKVKVIKDNKLACEMIFQATPLCLDFFTLFDKDFMVIGGIEGTIYIIKLKWL